ncbi:carbon-nitrogen hydrolase family protein [Candidatus Amarolinea dominans]|uniref:carbon-nitrogen hydrolase family protein n=1 Tax=Candidatus Amarolinea dominans TaxID=3140696 RepID=UPI001DC83173|nr:carbon-nitrogen hydrolase family protein [Anaerolineae bacterium]
MREITIAVVQFQPTLNEPDENIRRMSDFINKICTEQPVDLVVFPELTTTGHECGLRFTDYAETVPGPTVSRIAKDAGNTTPMSSSAWCPGAKVESVLYNTAVVIGPDGELIGSYGKVHLKGEERLAFRNGFRFPVFETEWGNLGVLVGWDMAFPEAARSLALDGADVVAVCANREGLPHQDEWRAYCVARACENSVFVAAANRVGEEPSYQFFGDSMARSARAANATPAWKIMPKATALRASTWTWCARRARSFSSSSAASRWPIGMW